MSNSIAPGSSADVNVRVTALTTNPNVPVTYKTIILKKNLVNGVNTLTQAMMSAQNTKYVIKYDYILGEDITVPTNCILEFDGGSFDGSHVITGSKMPTNIVYTPEMFGAGVNNDDTKAIQSAVNICKNIRMDGVYNVYANTNITDNPAITIPSSTSIEINGTINYLTTDLDTYSIFLVNEGENVNICGNGVFIGDKNIHSGSTGEWGHGISIISSKNVSVKGNIELYNFWGDGIYLGYDAPYNQNIVIDGVIIHDCRRNGISVTSGINIEIQNFSIYNIVGTNPQAGIDIENQTGDAVNGINGVSIYNGIIKNCNNRTITQMGIASNNVVIDKMCLYGTSVVLLYDAIIKNSYFYDDAELCPNDSCLIDSCFNFYLNWFNPGASNIVEIRNSKILSIRDSGNSSDGVCKYYNSTIDVSGTSGSKTYRINGSIKNEFYNCELLISGYTDLKIKNSVYNQCNITFKDGVHGEIIFSKCIINAMLEGNDDTVFENSYPLKASDSQINILNNKVIPLCSTGNSTTNKIKFLSCAVIDVLDDRQKVYGDSHPERLIDTDTDYIVDA